MPIALYKLPPQMQEPFCPYPLQTHTGPIIMPPTSHFYREAGGKWADTKSKIPENDPFSGIWRKHEEMKTLAALVDEDGGFAA